MEKKEHKILKTEVIPLLVLTWKTKYEETRGIAVLTSAAKHIETS